MRRSVSSGLGLAEAFPRAAAASLAAHQCSVRRAWAVFMTLGYAGAVPSCAKSRAAAVAFSRHCLVSISLAGSDKSDLGYAREPLAPISGAHGQRTDIDGSQCGSGRWRELWAPQGTASCAGMLRGRRRRGYAVIDNARGCELPCLDRPCAGRVGPAHPFYARVEPVSNDARLGLQSASPEELGLYRPVQGLGAFDKLVAAGAFSCRLVLALLPRCRGIPRGGRRPPFLFPGGGELLPHSRALSPRARGCGSTTRAAPGHLLVYRRRCGNSFAGLRSPIRWVAATSHRCRPRAVSGPPQRNPPCAHFPVPNA
eukprot:16446761-Heterocapsa_arctica.AAC.1